MSYDYELSTLSELFSVLLGIQLRALSSFSSAKHAAPAKDVGESDRCKFNISFSHTHSDFHRKKSKTIKRELLAEEM